MEVYEDNHQASPENIFTSSSHVVLTKSAKHDYIADKYFIRVEEPIASLSNEFCKYYYASVGDENDLNYFAIVFEEKTLPPVKLIETLHSKNISGLNKILAYGITSLSSTKCEHLVVIIDKYDFKQNLQEYIIENGPISTSKAESIIGKIIELFADLNKEGIIGICGINPENVILKNGHFSFLKEFFTSPANYYQHNQYLAPEILECHKAGRRHGSLKIDIYALGVTIYYALSKSQIWEDYASAMEYNEARLEDSSFKILCYKQKFSERARTFLRWTLSDNPAHRWKMAHIRDWLSNKGATSSAYESLSNAKNTISFDDKNYTTAKALVYNIFHQWEKGTKFIRDEKIYKWASREHLNTEILSSIKEIIVSSEIENNAVVNIHANYKVSKLLSILDPYGPVRYMDLAMCSQTLPELLYYLFVVNRKDLIENLVKIEKDQLWEHYTEEESPGYLPPNLLALYTKSFQGFSTNSIVKGLERLIYALNPNARCMSKILAKKYVTNIPELIIALEEKAKENKGKFTIDRHIVAFVAAKYELKSELKPVILLNFPNLNEHPVIRNISVMYILQEHESSIPIPNICKQIIADLRELFAQILHGSELKKNVEELLTNLEDQGSVTKLVNSFSNHQQFINDYNNYNEACRTAKQLENQIFMLSRDQQIYRHALLIGQKLTVLLSYILCFIVTITIIM
jgi:serine/threonine protein kinase